MKRRVLKDPETGELIGLTKFPFPKAKKKESSFKRNKSGKLNLKFWILISILFPIFSYLISPSLFPSFLIISLISIFFLFRKSRKEKLEIEHQLQLEKSIKESAEILTKKIPLIIQKLHDRHGLESLDSNERNILFATSEKISSNTSSLHPNELKLLEYACGNAAIFNLLQLRGSQIAQSRQEEALRQISDKLSKVKHSSFAGPIAAWQLDNFIDS